MNKWRRAVLAIETFQTNVWPETEAEFHAIEFDVAFLRARYEAMKWKLTFREAAYRAKTELLERIEKETS